MRQHALNLGRISLTRHYSVADRQQDFSNYSAWGVDQQVEREADRTLRRVLDRHHAQVGTPVFDRLEDSGDGWLWLEAGARAETGARCFMAVSMFRTEIGDPHRLLQCGAGRYYLDEDPLQ